MHPRGGLGRDVELLRRLSKASGAAIVTNTGYYGAAEDKFVPAHAWKESAEQLAARWIAEARTASRGTGIRPGFKKIGVDAGPLSEIDARLVRAAGLTHQATGLGHLDRTRATAGSDRAAGPARVDGGTAEAFIWIHAQNEKDRELHVKAARRGAWVEFDGVSDEALEAHQALVLHMSERQLLHRTLISHDAGWYHVGGAPTAARSGRSRSSSAASCRNSARLA